MPNIVGWSAFAAVIAVMLVVDLAVAHRKPHAVSLREAAVWSAIWVSLAVLFGAGVWWWNGAQAGLEYFTGYTIEKALSVDNLFVFVVLFRYFQVPPAQQHRVLFWGVLGALVMRGVMIAAGIVLIERFDWVIYFFGALLIVTGIRLLGRQEAAIAPDRNPVLVLMRRFTPALAARPLVVVLVLVETTDLIFAVDSIPAILAITQDPFIVYTSNVFAILGLRSLYFLLAGVVDRFHYLRLGLAVILVLIGLKMLLADIWHVPVALSLAAVLGILTAAVIASVLFPHHSPPPAHPEAGGV